MNQLLFAGDGTPLTCPEDVIPFLGRPSHWRQGRSAYETAHSWFEAQDLPRSIRSLIESDTAFSDAVLERAFLEKETPLDRFGRPSQTDVLALLRTPLGQAILAVEAKVDETFGPLVSEWNDGTPGKVGRLAGLLGRLGLATEPVGHLRYQLLHRAASAVIEAEQAGAQLAALVVQSFSPPSVRAGFADFQTFAAAIGVPLEAPGQLSLPVRCGDVLLKVGWAQDQVSASGDVAPRAVRAGDKDSRRTPYRHPQPPDSPPEIVIADAIPADERLWVPQAENVWFRPLCLSASRGYWQNLLRVRKSGVLSRHRHPQPVHGYVLKGRWRYLEHDWVATEGAYVYEAPGETHTLVVDDDVEEMITMFQVNGAMIYVDPDGAVLGYEDVFTKIELCRRHFADVGLGADYVERFIR